MRSTAAFMVPEVGDGQDDRKFAVILVFFLMGICNRGKGTGTIRLSSLKSQIHADFTPSPEGAPGTLPGSWHFAGKCARSGSQARLRRAAPCSPAPAPFPRPPAASACPRSPEPLACAPARARSSLLFRAFLAARSPALGVRAPPPTPPSPGSPQGGVREGRQGRGGRGGGDKDLRPIASGRPKRKEGGRSCGPPAPAFLPPPRSNSRAGRAARGPGAQGRGAQDPERAGCVQRLPNHFGKVPLILHAFLRGWSPDPAPSR